MIIALVVFMRYLYDETNYSPKRGIEYYKTSIELVRKRVKEGQNINIVKSNIITDNLPDEIEHVAVCNIDVDLYEAVQYALYKVKDRVVKGGVIIAEDYGHTPELLGAQLAIDEFYEENEDEWFKIVCTSGQCLLIRQ